MFKEDQLLVFLRSHEMYIRECATDEDEFALINANMHLTGINVPKYYGYSVYR